ncbi:hypothetical protein D3C73_1532360 [compost metagenome]
MNAHRAFGGADHGTSYLTVLAQQAGHGRRLPEQHAEVVGGFCQTRHQGNAVDQLHRPAMHGEVDQVTTETPRNVPGRRQ